MSTKSSASSPSQSSASLPQHAEKADFTLERKGGSAVFALSGSWTVDSLQNVEKHLRSSLAGSSGQGSVVIDLQGLSRLDTAGALLINESLAAVKGKGGKAELRGADEQQEALLKFSAITEEEKEEGQAGRLTQLLQTIGKAVVASAQTAVELTGFFGQFLCSLVYLVLHPGRTRWTSLVFHMEQTGLKAIPIVSLLTFLIGVVVAYMGSQQLQKFGAQVFAVNLLEVSIMREMGVLITAIVVAGRSSSSFTAQIGAMVANEEVAAIRSMGLDPMVLLVVPRVVALLITLPFLVFIADIMALFGGAVAIQMTMDLSFTAFIAKYHEIALLQNFLVGISKTPFFAIIIGIVGCFQGFKATSSAESVGFLTTIAVVQSIFLVILADALFALFFTSIGV